MKRVLIYLLGVMLLLNGLPVFAEETQEAQEPEAAEEEQIIAVPTYDYDELIVGSTTPLAGSFFTQMWGNVTSDLDVRMLIHGYNLVEWNSELGGFQIDPSVVSNMTATQNVEGDRTYTLTLYEDLVYNDGSPITAWDYAFSLLLNIAPQITEIGGSIRPMEYILGCEEYLNGETQGLQGVRVVTDQMIAITVSHEYLPFFYELGLLDCVPYPISVIAPGCVVRDDGEGVYIANADENAAESLFTAELLKSTILDPETGYLTHPTVTSGPYRLVSFDGTKAEFELNENYKGNAQGIRPTIPRIVYEILNKNDMLDLLSDGSVVLLNKCVSADMLQQGMTLVGERDYLTVSNYMRNGLAFITFCCEQPTVSDAAVRQAISMCLDKDALITETVSNFGIRVDGYFGMGQWMYQLLSGAIAYPVEELEENATQAEKQANEEALAAWAELTLNNNTVYGLDTDAALSLLTGDGWTLNREGQNFDPARDDVRCKRVNDEIVALDLTLLCPKENGFAPKIQEAFAALADIGVKLTVTEATMDEVLNDFYRQGDRTSDMIFMASNFDVVFDPSANFMPDGDEVNPYNFSAINDEELYLSAVDMRMTEPTDLFGYCQKWVAFQEKIQEAAPLISIYSNVYMDFYARVLQNYNITENVSWSQAAVSAYLSDMPDVVEEEEEEEFLP